MELICIMLTSVLVLACHVAHFFSSELSQFERGPLSLNVIITEKLWMNMFVRMLQSHAPMLPWILCRLQLIGIQCHSLPFCLCFSLALLLEAKSAFVSVQHLLLEAKKVLVGWLEAFMDYFKMFDKKFEIAFGLLEEIDMI